MRCGSQSQSLSRWRFGQTQQCAHCWWGSSCTRSQAAAIERQPGGEQFNPASKGCRFMTDREPHQSIIARGQCRQSVDTRPRPFRKDQRQDCGASYAVLPVRADDDRAPCECLSVDLTVWHFFKGIVESCTANLVGFGAICAPAC